MVRLGKSLFYQVIMNTEKRFLFLVLFVSVLGACKKKTSDTSIHFFSELIPGSKYHQENGTWWGYNQQKIVRFQNRVFMAVVENENLDLGLPNAGNPSMVYLYAKTGDQSWSKGVGFPTSRPVNLLMDSEGCLHVFVFEPTENSPTENGSLGKLKHYWLPNAHLGDLFSFQSETVVDHSPGQSETVNIRIGASIAGNDWMYISFGLNQDVKVYRKHVHGQNWNEEQAGTNLGNSYYYPFVATKNNEPCLLAIQDDYVGPGLPAIYFKNKFFSRSNGIWTEQTITDLSTHPLTSSRNKLVDNCELISDENQEIYGIYQTMLNPNNSWMSTFYQIKFNQNQTTETKAIPLEVDDINRIRIFPYQGELFYFCISYNHLYVKRGLNGTLTEINLPQFQSGNYLYIANSTNGTSHQESYIDLLLLNGNAADYPFAKNYYVRIPKTELLKL